MRNDKVIPVTLAVLLFAGTLLATEPNFVRSTIVKGGKTAAGVDVDITSTSYIDGNNRNIQSKISIASDKDRVVCTYYDEIGRVVNTTKPFIDNQQKGRFLPGDLQNSTSPVKTQLQATYGDAKAYSTTSYETNPIGNPAVQNGPGAAYTTQSTRFWYMGIGLDNITFTEPITSTSVSFAGGFITSALTVTLLDALQSYLLDNRIFEPAIGTGTFYKLTVVKDFKDIYTQQLEDNQGRVVAVRSDLSPAAGDEIIQRYKYDILGNLTKEIAPTSFSGSTPVKLLEDAEYKYDRLNRVVWAKTPDGGEFEYTYTPRGEIEYVFSIVWDGTTKKNVRMLKYTYDNFGRLDKINELLGSIYIPRTVVKYSYDTAPAPSTHPDIPEYYLRNGYLKNLKGRLVAITATNYIGDETYRVTDFFSYDGEGRIDYKYKYIAGMPLQIIHYTYDLQGKILTESFDCGGATVVKEYKYDELGRLSEIQDATNSGKPLATYTYDDKGRMQNKNLKAIGATGYVVGYDFNIKEWLTSITSPAGRNGFSEQIHGYDANGNIVDAQYTYVMSGPTFDVRLNYGYDDVNRLTGVTVASITGGTAPTYASTYTYDPAGRITRKKEGANDYTGYAYFGATGSLTNRLKRAKTTSGEYYVYDKHGNLVVDFTKKMVVEYDWRNLPVVFRFFDNLTGAGITFNTATGTCTNTDLYGMLLSNGSINLVSTVTMIYDAGGNRVAKMEKKS